jgi:PleD family two-component response regulator
MRHLNQTKILIVDDQEIMRALAVRTLRHIGFPNACEAANGADGLAAALAWRPDIIISDYDMPEMDGLSLLEKVRGSSGIAETGFILLSGASDGVVVKKACDLGVSDFIVKPFELADFRRRVERLAQSILDRPRDQRGALEPRASLRSA